MDNGGSKASIWLFGRRRSCLAQLRNLRFFGKTWCRRRIFSPIQPVYLSDNKTCTWKPGHSHHWYVQKNPHHGGVNIWNDMKTSITFYTFCLFISFLVFLHFYICNVRFVSANNKFLIFIYIIIIILKFIITFLPVNIGKFCKQIFNFYCKW